MHSSGDSLLFRLVATVIVVAVMISARLGASLCLWSLDSSDSSTLPSMPPLTLQPYKAPTTAPPIRSVEGWNEGVKPAPVKTQKPKPASSASTRGASRRLAPPPAGPTTVHNPFVK
jgi:hypothetical protein